MQDELKLKSRLPKAFDETGIQFAWDQTSIHIAEECLRKYQYRMIEGWQHLSKSVHLLFGGWYASALESFHQYLAQGMSRDDALVEVVTEALVETWEYDDCETCQGKGVIDETLGGVPRSNPEAICPDCNGDGRDGGNGHPWQSGHNLKTRETLIRTIVWYTEQYKEDPAETVILSTGKAAVEHSFTLEVDGGLMFTGHLDRCVEYAGHRYVQDQKAQPISEKVLTPLGWKPVGRLEVGVEIIGEDGLPHKVLELHPKGEVEIFEVHFVDGTSTRCAWDHLWGVYDQFGKYQVLSMEQIALAPAYKKFRVPLMMPVQFPERTFILNPLALGLLIGDGYFNHHTIQFSDADGVEAGLLSKVLPEGDDIVSTSSDNYSWNIRGTHTREALKTLGLFGKLSGGKFIPEEYFLGSEGQRRQLLRGLLLTDGCNIGTNYLYDTTSEQLIKDVCQLVRSLGGVASYHTRSGPAYRAHLRMPEWPNGVRARYIKKVVKLPYTEEAVCIKVDAPRNLYVTEDYILTHNTTGTTISARYFDNFNPDTQFSMYTWAGKMLWNTPVKGVMIDAAQIAVGFTRFERGFAFRSDAQLAEWYDHSLWHIEQARTATRENFFPMNRSACGNFGGCEFRQVCSRSPEVRPNFLKAEFVRGERWDPLKAR